MTFQVTVAAVGRFTAMVALQLIAVVVIQLILQFIDKILTWLNPATDTTPTHVLEGTS